MLSGLPTFVLVLLGLAAAVRLAFGAAPTGPGSQLPARRARALTLVGVAWALGYLVLQALSPLPEAQRVAVSNVLFLPVGAAVTWAALRASQAAALTPVSRLAWRRLAAGLLLLWVGDATGSYAESVLGLADPGHEVVPYLAACPFLLMGLMTFPAQSRAGEWLEFWLDAATVALAAGLVVWHLHPPGNQLEAASAAYFVAEVVVLVAAAVALGRPGEASARIPLRLFSAGLAAVTTADLVRTLVPELAGSATWPDWLAMSAWWFMGVAGLAQAGTAPVPNPPAPVRSPWLSSLGPRAALLAACAALAGLAVSSWGAPLASLLLGALGLTLLGLARQMVTERENLRLLAEQAAREGERRLVALVRNASDVILLTDADGRLRFASPSLLRTLRVTPEESLGRPFSELLAPGQAPAAADLLDEAVRRAGHTARAELLARRSDGSLLYVEVLAQSLLNEPSVRGVAFTLRDVDERKRLEQQLERLAFRDPLTGLANRALLSDRLEHALRLARREERWLAILLLDLDDFKHVNDGLGHLAGDAVLVETGRRLQKAVREGDTVARLGGDEFVALLEQVSDGHEAAAVATRLAESLRAPFRVAEREVAISGSIGIALGGPGARSAAELLRNADLAMYEAKARGKARIQAFEPGMHASVLSRLELAHDLRTALDRGDIHVAFQPVVELESGRVVGCEALARWTHPQRGPLSPAEFVPLAEETGLLERLSTLVLERACEEAAGWSAESSGPYVAVNLSARQLEEGVLSHSVTAVLRQHGLDPRRLVLEVTETALVRAREESLRPLSALRKEGVRLAIDDFGTGYSSLAQLHQLPVDMLKIDRRFVEQAGLASELAPLLKAIVQMGHALGLEVVAEGVETESQARALAELGCDRAQGFLFAHPLEPGAVRALLSAGPLAGPAVR